MFKPFDESLPFDHPTSPLDAERAEILAAVESVMAAGQWIQGDSVASMERLLAAYCGVEHCAAVDGATAAMVTALRALGVQADDEVITTADASPAVALAIELLGAKPGFLDIDPDTGMMDIDLLRGRVGRATTCIVAAHRNGHCADMSQILSIAGARGLPVVEDASLALGASLHGARAGAMGYAGVISFHPGAVLAGTGKAAIVVTDDAETDARVRTLRNLGCCPKGEIVDPGYDCRLDEIQAAVICRRMANLESTLEERQRRSQRYAAGLRDLASFSLPTVARGSVPAWPIYAVGHADPTSLLDALARSGVALRDARTRPLHLMPGFRHLGYRQGDLPATEAAMEEVVYLPTHPALGDDVQDRIIGALRAAAIG